MRYFTCFSHLNTSDSTKEVIIPLRIFWVYGDFTDRHCEIPALKKKKKQHLFCKIIQQCHLQVMT